MTKKTAQLIVSGHEPVDLPIYTPTLGNDVIDINQLSSVGLFTYDPGFVSTASCESKITYIDGDKGTLLYRGYPIEQLAENKVPLRMIAQTVHVPKSTIQRFLAKRKQ